MNPKVHELTQVIVPWASLIFGVIAGVVALQAYQTEVRKNVDERVVRAFEMQERFDSLEFRNLRTQVSKAGQLGLFCSATNEPRFEISDQDLYAFVGFFDAVEMCVEEQICNRGTAMRLFEPFANGYYPGLKKHIAAVRAAEKIDNFPSSAQYAHGLQILARHPVPEPVCP